jgi:ATP-dependent RNA helicase DeaD
VLIVPYPRRRRVEGMLRDARITAEWIGAPTPEDIRAKDRERMLEALLAPVEIDDEDRALAKLLLKQRGAEEIAAALVKAHRAALPAPEDLIDGGRGAQGGSERGERGERGGQTDGHRAGFEDVVWFRMDVGRRQNADPRWILPLLCRRGHITKNEIGAIRIAPDETRFQVPRAIAARFASAVARTADAGGEDESGVRIEQADGPLSHADHKGPRGAPGQHQHHAPRKPAGGKAPGGKPPYKGKRPR